MNSSDEAIEARLREFAAAVAAEDDPTFGSTENVDQLVTDLTEWIAARVRAEAVADERRRIADEIAELPLLFTHGGAQFPKSPEQVRADAAKLAAGSVPVATPATCSECGGLRRGIPASEAHPAGACLPCLHGPVLTPPARAVPEGKETKPAAQLIREIAAADPEAHLRAIGRGCGGAGVGPVATPAEPPALTPNDCTCEDDGGCIDYYDEDRPGDCPYCNWPAAPDGPCPAVIRSAASPVPAEQPPGDDDSIDWPNVSREWLNRERARQAILASLALRRLPPAEALAVCVEAEDEHERLLPTIDAMLIPAAEQPEER